MNNQDFINSDEFRTFANRFARYMFLSHVCDLNHPVLKIEIELLKIAKSKLQEFVFRSISGSQMKSFRPLFESWVKSIARKRILGFDEDDKVKELIILSIKNKNFEDLFQMVH